jgi:hypothetical protein
LRTAADLLGELERLVVDLERSAGDRVQRAKAVASIVGQAHTILASRLDENAKALDELLRDRPQLAAALRRKVGPGLALVPPDGPKEGA